MKRIIFPLSAVTIVIALTTALSVTSCQKEARNQSATSSTNELNDKLANRGAPLKVDLLPFGSHLEGENMLPPMDDATPLYNKNGAQHVPIMTPDGMHHVTYGEFKMASGWANIKCINSGTHVVMHLKGLIPNGAYTIWTVIFKEPGFNGVSIPVNRIGFGALGAIEGSNNSNAFIADAEGNASISVIRAAGKLGTDGSVNPHPDYVVPNCLGDAFETHLALAYHLNNTASAPGAPPTWAVQGFFQFWGSQL